MKAKPDLVAKYKLGRPGEQGNPIYAAMIESLDDSVGRVLKKLDEFKLAERTLVVFVSDNGGLCVTEGPNTPPTINSPLRDGKGSLYEGGLPSRSSFAGRGLRRPAASAPRPSTVSTCSPPSLTLVASKSDAKTDGLNLTPLLKGETLQRADLFWHYPHYSNQGGRPGAVVRAGGYKLIEFFEDGRRELYDLTKDIGESRNLIDDKPEVAKELHAKLDAWRKEVGARMMKPNPDYVPNPQAKDGGITLPARTAEVHGVQLRYEPLPHKNTLGYWTRAEDWASWEFTVTTPGTFTVEMLQGCGKDQGGSAVELSVGEQTLAFTVEDTGHFQNFLAREVGKLSLNKPGRYTLMVKPKKKAAAAVMDLRSIILKPSEK